MKDEKPKACSKVNLPRFGTNAINYWRSSPPSQENEAKVEYEG
jgi:hypothetical protein